jgi:ribosomal protein L11 methyltransferase
MKPENPILKIEIPEHAAEMISFYLEEEGAVAIEERDASTMTQAEEGRIALVAGFETEVARGRARKVLERLRVDGMVLTDVDEIDDDWQTKWREFFKPVVLKQLQIITPWMTPPRDDRSTIVIDPGQAFGTGGHATTRLILQLLEDLSFRDALPSRILDVGAGSGILALAARRLGALEVVGIDIDPEAKIAFEENTLRNGMADGGLSCLVGTAAEVSGAWPLVLANIQLDVFRACAAEVTERVAPSGMLFISGILADQVAALERLFPCFRTLERRDEEEWAALVLLRTR